METRRWLLPFTSGVDMRAIDTVIGMAESVGAVTLVAVSLIYVPEERRSRGVRLEQMQQSQDFLEVMRLKAAQSSVPLELYEVDMCDVLESITLLMYEQHCDSIVLVTSESRDVLLSAYEVKQVLEQARTSLVLLRLPAQTQRTRHLAPWLLSWLQRLWKPRNAADWKQDTPEVEEPCWIKMEEQHWG